MKPQLIIQDFQGASGKDLPETAARLTRGGSWKKQRIVVVIPAADEIPSKVYLSHLNLGFAPNNGVLRLLALGQEVGEAYSNAIEQILAHPQLSDWEYILTIEHDNAPPSDGVVRLLERMEEHPELSCIGGLYFTKGPRGVAQIWGDPNDPVLNFRPQVPDVNGNLKECVGTGMGFNLWRLKMFKDPKLRKPWFKTLKGSEGQGMGTQDLYFWGDARKYGYRCAVDCSIKVGHYDLKGEYGPPDTMW